MSHQQSIQPAPAASSRFALPLIASLAVVSVACSTEVLNVGENADELLIPSDSRCALDTTLPESVLVTSQAELDQLEGCASIDGDLHVVPFEGADLRPLHALTEVTGALAFAGAPDTVDGAEVNRIEALYDAGWLTSLEGLEALESVGALRIVGLSASSLTPLANLRFITQGDLHIQRCSNLRDLDGLQNLSGVDYLHLMCRDLESMAALRLGRSMNALSLVGPALTDLGALEVEHVANEIIIMDTQLEHLDGLAALRSVSGGFLIQGNSALVDMSGLDGLEVAGTLHLKNNAQLERLPELPALSRLYGLMLYDNPRLSELSELPALFQDFLRPGVRDQLTERDLLAWRPDYIEIVNNPELQQLTMPSGWLSGSHVVVRGNAKLAAVDFSQLRSIDVLSIEDNPLLADVELGALATIDSLTVRDNPQLPETELDPVQSFQRTLSGNATTGSP